MTAAGGVGGGCVVERRISARGVFSMGWHGWGSNERSMEFQEREKRALVAGGWGGRCSHGFAAVSASRAEEITARILASWPNS